MSIDPISRRKKFVRRLGLRLTLLAGLIATPRLAEAQSPPPLFTPAPTFSATNRYVAVSVFQWFTSNGGQLTGPWRPREGRSNWTGTPDFWKGQIKQMMAANIDVLYVHLIPSSEAQRTNLFIALHQLRAEGYDTPKIAPFLDPLITWDQKPLVDLATVAGKDEFVGQYLRFYHQYFGVSTGAYADDYLARQANKPVLDTWHVQFNCANLNSLTRADVANRLGAALGAAHPYFTNGFVMVTTALNPPTLSFADEKVPQFEITKHYYPATYNSIRSVQLKGGYWDENIRNPGSFLARAGGVNYSNAWHLVDRLAVRRVYLESWNEYDEGTGIYAGTNLPPYIAPANTSSNTDVWSTTGDPFEYIKTTARGAASFNDTPAQGARILWHNLPATLTPGETRTATVIVRNTGDASWTAGTNYKLGQGDTDTAFIAGKRVLINDTQDEIPLYGGLFRGRAKAFQMTLTAPALGSYSTHWRMVQEGGDWFGEELVVPITVKLKTAATVTLSNLSQVADGTAKSVSATTMPPGLTVNLTYNGSLDAPTDPGSYTIVGFINDPDYQGSATNTLILTANPNLFAHGSFEAQADGTSITSPPDFIAGALFTGWRVFDVASADRTFSATIIGHASAGSHALRLAVNKTTGDDNYALDQWDVGMHTPVRYGTNYLVFFDAAWIAGATANNLLAYVNEFDNRGTYIGTSENLGLVSVSTTGYKTFTFAWTPVNPGTTEIGLGFRPLPGAAGETTLSLDNVKVEIPTTLPVNGTFEYSPIGTSATLTTPTVDTTTFLGWRLFSVGAPPINLFRGTIVDASDFGAGGTPGNQVIRLDVDNTGAPAGYDYGLDRDNAKVAVAYGTTYVLAFDAVLYGVTGPGFSFVTTLAEYDGADAFTGSQTPFTPALPADALFHHYAFSWTPLNPNTTRVNLAFRPRNPGFLNAVGLDNVGLTAVTSGVAQQLLGRYPGLILTGTVGAHYRVEYATALAPTTWLLLQDLPRLPGSPFMVYDPAAATQPHRFYRAVVLP